MVPLSQEPCCVEVAIQAINWIQYSGCILEHPPKKGGAAVGILPHSPIPASRFDKNEKPLNGGPPFKWFISKKMRRESAGGSLLIGPAWILYGGRRQRFSDKGNK